MLLQAGATFMLKLHNMHKYKHPKRECKVSVTTCSLQLIQCLSSGFAEALVWNQGHPAH